MKKIFYFLLFFLPVFASAQQNCVKSSLLDHTWQNVGNAGFSANGTQFTSLAFSTNGEPYVAYMDWSSYKATVMKFDGTSWVNVGDTNFSAADAYNTSLAFSPVDSLPYVAYGYFYQGATVMKFNGTTWVTVGNSGFSEGGVYYTSLAFSPSGEPYVAYSDFRSGYGTKATVMKFDGTNWVYVGNEGFSIGQANFTRLAFNTSGEPYVAYEDFENSSKATVMKFDGTNWVCVGNAGFSSGYALNISFAFSPSGEPFVAFRDGINKATVMKFDGANWMNVGNPSFSEGEAAFLSLAFSPSGEPYVSYADGQYSAKVVVMKYNGNNWISVGDAGFSSGGATYTSLVFNPSGKPYVAFVDYGNLKKATVMKYDSVFVGINEPKESRLSIYPNPASTQITIETSAISTPSKLSILNLHGQQVLTRQITEPKTVLDIKELPSGGLFCADDG